MGPGDACVRLRSLLVQIMACHLLGANQSFSYKLHVCVTLPPLVPGSCGNTHKSVIFKLIFQIDILNNSYEIALRRMPHNPFDDKSTLDQVMAWCRQATSYYLNQYWPSSKSLYGVTSPQWVKWQNDVLRLLVLLVHVRHIGSQNPWNHWLWAASGHSGVYNNQIARGN